MTLRIILVLPKKTSRKGGVNHQAKLLFSREISSKELNPNDSIEAQ